MKLARKMLWYPEKSVGNVAVTWSVLPLKKAGREARPAPPGPK